MILTPMEAFIGTAINFISRRFEFEADRFACELQDRLSAPEMEDMGDRLGRALVTLHVKNLSTVWVDWLCAFFDCAILFIGDVVDPIGTRRTTIRILHWWSDSRPSRTSRRNGRPRKRRGSRGVVRVR